MKPTPRIAVIQPVKERRAHPRAKADFRVVIAAADRRIEARVRDISQSGVCFISPKPILEMTAVKLELALPGMAGEMLSVRGAIVRNEKTSDGEYEIAIFFTGITESERERIREFVNSRQPVAV
ncbi:MAG: PilZ domain-containing protein [Planctomycetes bacterium]|nr:PilZ domain-containing protein [Planctomycetota bacterium]